MTVGGAVRGTRSLPAIGIDKTERLGRRGSGGGMQGVRFELTDSYETRTST